MAINKDDLKADLLSEVSLHNGGNELAESISDVLDTHITPLDCCNSDRVSVLRTASKILKTMPFYSAKCVLKNLDKLADSLEKQNG